MKYGYLLFTVCLVYLLFACKPELDLNASYKEATIVYGLLNYQDSIQYVKIYKGFQTSKNGVFFDARNPDSIYYYDKIKVVLLEFENDKRTSRDSIHLFITHDFPRDAGTFYYDKEKIIYYTKEPLFKDKVYKIVIKNKITNTVTEGETPMVGGFEITYPSQTLDMLSMSNSATVGPSTVSFSKAENDYNFGYEIHVSFIYFEVDKKTNQVVKTGKILKNISQKIGDPIHFDGKDKTYKLDFTKTFYDDIAAQLKPDLSVVRYIGSPNHRGMCFEIEGWAAGESFVNFLLSNQPIASFVQVNTLYTNITSTQGLTFGFLSSRSRSITHSCSTTEASEKELVSGSKTGHLGFRPYLEYKP